jgi:hypothetical protein
MGTLTLTYTFPDTDAKVGSLLYPYPSSTARNETLQALVNFQNEFSSGSLSLTSGIQALGGAAASGTATFSGNPTAADTLTVNGRVWTFVASGATTYQVNIGADLATTLASFVTKWNAAKATTDNISNISVSASATVLTFTADAVGLAGNAFTLAKSSTAITVSGANFTGGTAATSYTF